MSRSHFVGLMAAASLLLLVQAAQAKKPSCTHRCASALVRCNEDAAAENRRCLARPTRWKARALGRDDSEHAKRRTEGRYQRMVRACEQQFGRASEACTTARSACRTACVKNARPPGKPVGCTGAAGMIPDLVGHDVYR